jgi:hypothetical protein
MIAEILTNNSELCSINNENEFNDTSPALIETSTKIHSLYHGSTYSRLNYLKIWNLPQATIDFLKTNMSHYLRDKYFFALKNLPERKQMALEGEIKYFYDFWDPKAPLDPNLPMQQRIRDSFVMKDEVIEVYIGGQRLAVTCRVVETKDISPKQKPYNFVFVPGNLTNFHNNIILVYPFLASYLRMHDASDSLPPGRFIMTTQYEIRTIEPDGSKGIYSPESLDYVGTVLAEILEKINHKYGEVDQLMAHSLGTIIFSSCLKHLKKAILPKHLLVHCGPSSLIEASKNIPILGKWGFLGKLASCVGWHVDLAEEIATFCKKNPEVDITISGVLEDHYFKGDANLCKSPKMRDLKEKGLIKDLLTFCPPFQMFDAGAQHNLPFFFLVPNYLIDPSSSHFVDSNDRDFSQSIIRRSFPNYLKDQKVGTEASI